MPNNAVSPAWSVIEPHWLSLNEAWDSGPEAFVKQIAGIPQRAGLLYAGNWCVSEVENGGFLQFFWNSTGILAPEALRCFEAMGAVKLARPLDAAMSYFGSMYPRDRQARIQRLGGRSLRYPTATPFQAEDEAFSSFLARADSSWEKIADEFAEGA